MVFYIGTFDFPLLLHLSTKINRYSDVLRISLLCNIVCRQLFIGR